jgi:purine catabolism regulator
MKTTVKAIIDLEIFQSFDILSAKDSIHNEFESISILETPDFDNYIIEKSLILTTIYPIKDDLEKFESLMYILAKKKTAAVIVKINRYIDKIPENILTLSNQLNLPIIVLTYDANLSVLFNNILSELQRKDYYDASFDTNYSQFLKEVYDNPTTKTLLSIVSKIEDLDILIYNIDNKKTYYSDDSLLAYFNKHQASSNLFHRVDQVLYYTEDVIYDEQAIYKVLFRAKNERRHILHSYIEIFKLMIIVIYQKKVENTLKQNQFLLSFVSNLTSNYSNAQLIEASKRYRWDIQFPLSMVLFSIKNKENVKFVINPSMIEYIRQVFINKFHVHSDELRYTIQNNQLLFIINTYTSLNIDETVKNIYETIFNKYSDHKITVTYSNLIKEASIIPQTYTSLSEALNIVENQNLGVHIFSESQVKLLNLFKTINYNDITTFINERLEVVFAYDKKHQSQLVHTLYTYIQSKFNIKKTAEKLFIHYNSVRYRLELLDSLGIHLTSEDEPYFDIYLALYLYMNFESKR